VIEKDLGTCANNRLLASGRCVHRSN
jgi:hypothetical protein